MNIIDHLAYQEGGILSKVIRKDADESVTLFCMGAGTDIEEHTTTKEGYIYVLEGRGTFSLESERIPMAAGTLIRLEKDVVHALTAERNTSFILILHD